jgi:hypothetical protein
LFTFKRDSLVLALALALALESSKQQWIVQVGDISTRLVRHPVRLWMYDWLSSTPMERGRVLWVQALVSPGIRYGLIEAAEELLKSATEDSKLNFTAFLPTEMSQKNNFALDKPLQLKLKWL